MERRAKRGRINFRSNFKAAVEQAAADEQRSISNWFEKLLMDHFRQQDPPKAERLASADTARPVEPSGDETDQASTKVVEVSS